MTESNLLNEILEFNEVNFKATTKIVESGQRVVYKGCFKSEEYENYVIKTCPVFPTSVARIQRELKILEDINSIYFPKSIHSQFISNENLNDYIDNIDPKVDPEKRDLIVGLKLEPFFVTVENFVEHLDWSDCRKTLSDNLGSHIEFLNHIFAALNILWDENIVHRDLKPDNILIGPNYLPTIIDFGIAKSLRDGTQMITHPLATSPCTPQFAAPEQLTNQKTEVTYKSDQFSMGVIIYWTLTGHFPFGNIQEIGIEDFIRNVSKGDIVHIHKYDSSISQEFADFIHKLLSIYPYKRFRNYEAIKEALDSIGECI